MPENKTGIFLSAVVVIALALFIYYETFTDFVKNNVAGGGAFHNSALYPQVIAGALIFLSLLLILTNLKKKDQTQIESGPLLFEDLDLREVEEPQAEDIQTLDAGGEPWKNRVRTVSGIFILICYIFSLDYFGYYLATPVMLLIFFRLLGVRGWIVTVLLSVGTTMGMFLFFQYFLNVVLPVGNYGFLLE